MTPIDRLRRLAALAPALGPEGAWFAARLREYLASEVVTLDDAFGLATPQSGRSWRTRTRQQQRDHLLRRLGEQFTGSRHAKATAVADALRRYQATGWRHERNLDELTQSVPELRKLMHAILRLDPSAPTGWRRLHEILGETDICREHGDLVAKDDGYSERASEDLA